MTWKIESAGPDAKRIMNGDAIAGFALRMSNGTWGAFDTADKRLNGTQFTSAGRVLTWFKRFGPDGPRRPT